MTTGSHGVMQVYLIPRVRALRAFVPFVVPF
jgi:hypothetical protein